jgi:hypothetical protein
MYGLKSTEHFQQRAQQRCVNATIVRALIKYGEAHSSRRGVDSLIFTDTALSDIMNDHGTIIFKMCEKFKNTSIIMSDDGTLITVARSYRKFVH